MTDVHIGRENRNAKFFLKKLRDWVMLIFNGTLVSLCMSLKANVQVQNTGRQMACLHLLQANDSNNVKMP